MLSTKRVAAVTIRRARALTAGGLSPISLPSATEITTRSRLRSNQVLVRPSDWKTFRQIQPIAAQVLEQKQCGIARFPSLNNAAGLLRASDYAGTCIFAATGAITGASCGLDLFGTVAIGSITALGGGTTRDAIILHRPPFWTEEVEYVWMALAAAAATFFLWPQVPAGNAVKDASGEAGPAMWWADAVSLGAFSVIGAMGGVQAGMGVTVAMLCGLSTATFGGVCRDLLCGLPKSNPHSTDKDGAACVRIFHSQKELYAVTALGGAGTFLAARRVTAGALPVVSGIAAATALRYVATTRGLGLPSWTQPEWRVDGAKLGSSDEQHALPS